MKTRQKSNPNWTTPTGPVPGFRIETARLFHYQNTETKKFLSANYESWVHGREDSKDTAWTDDADLAAVFFADELPPLSKRFIAVLAK